MPCIELVEPEVSVIVACFNKEKYIEESVLSVLGQTFTNFELIIVDDHSTDSGVELIKAIQKQDPRIILIANVENKGANYCRNTGIKAAKGRYLIFFDADDVLGKTCLMQRIQYMESHPSLDFSVHTMQVFKNVPGDSAHNWIPQTSDPLKAFLVHDLPWQTMQPIWKKEVLLKVDGFDESFQRLQDVELHTRVLLDPEFRYGLFAGAPDCYYRIDEVRKNFEPFNFLHRWLSAVVQYCDKFYGVLPAGKKVYLLGTVYQTYISLLLAFKDKKINGAELQSLESMLLSHKLIAGAGIGKKTLFKISKKYNLLPFRIPGFNRLLKKLVLN